MKIFAVLASCLFAIASANTYDDSFVCQQHKKVMAAWGSGDYGAVAQFGANPMNFHWDKPLSPDTPAAFAQFQMQNITNTEYGAWSKVVANAFEFISVEGDCFGNGNKGMATYRVVGREKAGSRGFESMTWAIILEVNDDGKFTKEHNYLLNKKPFGNTGAADYVIAGGGTAGSVLAGRLALAGKSVILLEQGPDDDWTGKNLLGEEVDLFSPVPGFEQHLAPEISTWNWWEPGSIQMTRDKDFATPNEYGEFVSGVAYDLYLASQKAVVDSGLIPIPKDWQTRELEVQSKIIGGCTVHNYMVYVRPGNHSLQSLGPGWEPDIIVPKYQRMEAEFLPVSTPQMTKNDQTFYDNAKKRGGCKVVANGRALQADKAHCAMAVTERTISKVTGRRMTSGSQFLTEKVRALPNLQIRTGAMVERVVLDGTTATGVEYRDADGKVHSVTANQEVIVSAGAYRSPQLLLLSGIGPKKHLDDMKIPVKVDLPGVGGNFHNHHLVLMTFHFRNSTEADVTSGAVALLLTSRSNQTTAEQDNDLWYTPFQTNYIGNNTMRIQIVVALYYDIGSSGRISLKSTDVADQPKVDFPTFSDEGDVQATIEGMNFLRGIMVGGDWEGVETWPGTAFNGTDREYIYKTGQTVWHSVGSCSMGSVLDQNLRVKGVSNLRVADNSAIPVVPNSNTQSMAYMVGYHGADLILGNDLVSSQATYSDVVSSPLAQLENEMRFSTPSLLNNFTSTYTDGENLGSERHSTILGMPGIHIVEVLVGKTQHSYSYSILAEKTTPWPLPKSFMPVTIEDYTATVTFVAIDRYNTAVTYTATYRTSPSQTQLSGDVLKGFYKLILDGAKSRLRVTDTPKTGNPGAAACQTWCAGHKQEWKTKCTWLESCGGCSKCSEKPKSDQTDADSTATDGDTAKDGVVPPGAVVWIVILIILLVGAVVAIVLLFLKMKQMIRAYHTKNVKAVVIQPDNA